MRSSVWFFLLVVSGTFVMAQQPVLNPRDSVAIRFDDKVISIEYGSPSLRDRPVIGEFVPYNKVWRTGSGRSTTFETTADLRLGQTEIPRGAYSLYTLPSPSQWKLIINKQTGQWGTVYNADLDLARIPMDQRRIQNKVRQLTFSLEKTGGRQGVLRMEWEFTSVSIPFEILEDPFIASPRDSVEIRLGEGVVSVQYGRPFRRGRKIEGQVVPYHEVWRTGANEATTLRTDIPLRINGTEVPAGSYSLYTIPAPKRWRLIINKQTGQQGTEYDRALDLARIWIDKESLKSPVDQFTILFEKKSETSALMRLMWEYFLISVPIEVSEGRRNGMNMR